MSEKKSGANAVQSITATTCLPAQTAAAETCHID